MADIRRRLRSRNVAINPLGVKKNVITKSKGVVAEKKVTKAALDHLAQQTNRIRITAVKVDAKKVTDGKQAKKLPEVQDGVEMGVFTVEPIQVQLPEGVNDIDKDDEDSQMVSEHVIEIFTYLRHLEKGLHIPPKFLSGSVISQRMRSILINWLIQVHGQFKLLQETLYLTVQIIDRYLSLQGHKVKKKSIQLVGITAMFIACKYEEMYVPEVDDFVYISDNTYSSNQILALEKEMIQVLRYKFGFPLAINFLRRNSKAGMVDVLHHNLAKFILEACLVDYTLASVKPSEMAAAALFFSSALISPQDLSVIWTRDLAYYSGYEIQSLQASISKISKVLLSVQNSNFTAVVEKYKSGNRVNILGYLDANQSLLSFFANKSSGV